MISAFAYTGLTTSKNVFLIFL